MKILHTEASNGWGGQEIRILREAIGLRERGHDVSFAICHGARLTEAAKDNGFAVEEVSFDRRDALRSVPTLRRLLQAKGIDVVNTHSSLDAWMAGVTARTCGVKVLRTRHLSAPIRAGLNSKLLYRWLADGVATTCQSVADVIRRQAAVSEVRCQSIPTGIDPTEITSTREDGTAFRRKFGIRPDDIVIGTLCIIRSWKGIGDLLEAAKLLQHDPRIKWLVVGNGPCEEMFQKQCRESGLEGKVIFTGRVSPPYDALQAMDIFSLLSTGNEGVSQASLQAAYLGLPLVTTRVGGLPEVCIDHITGHTVDAHAPKQVAEAVLRLVNNQRERSQMGQEARKLVEKHFLWDCTLDRMEEMLERISIQQA